MITAIPPPLYENYLAALLAGDRSRCTAIVQELCRAGVDLKDLYVNLFQRALYQIGELWEYERISVAVEHLATAITERLLTLVQPQLFSGPPRERVLIIACVADEYHELGARIVADFCELHGWRGHFLGANTPVVDLLQSIQQRKPRLVGLSLSLFSNLPVLLKALDMLSVEYPELPILAGGQAFRWGGLEELRKYRNVAYISSLDDLEKRILGAGT